MLEPNSAGTNFNLGVLFAATGKHKKAYEHFEKAVELRPNWPIAQYSLALVALKIGKRDEAFDHFETLKAIDPALAEKVRTAMTSSFVVKAN